MAKLPLVNAMRWTPGPGMRKLIEFAPPFALASRIAWRRVPTPLSASDVTTNAVSSRHGSSGSAIAVRGASFMGSLAVKAEVGSATGIAAKGKIALPAGPCNPTRGRLRRLTGLTAEAGMIRGR